MSKAKNGDTVKVHYTGKFDDGTVFDSSEGREPLEFTLGSGQVIPGFEEAIKDMEPGDKNSARITSEKAYGPIREDLIIEITRGQLNPDIKPEVGMQLQMQQPNGQTIIATIKEISENSIKIDANHPLAGKDLNFQVELVEIV